MIQEQIPCSVNRILFKCFKLYNGSRKIRKQLKAPNYNNVQLICQLYGLNWQSDILKIPHGFNFFKDLTINDFMG